MEGDTLTIRQAAALLNCHPNTVRNRIKKRTLRAEKVITERGETYMIPRSELENPTTNTLPSASHSQSPTNVSEGIRAVLEPFVRELGDVREELGRERERREQAERRAEDLERRLEAAERRQEPAEAPEEAEPRSAAGGAQAATERSQQRSGWLAPVDTLPWWQYALLVLWWVAWMTVYSVALFFDPLELWRAGYYIDFVANFLLLLVAPLSSGYWIGTRKRNASVWRTFLPIGLIAAALSLAVMLVFEYLLLLREPWHDLTPATITIINLPAYLFLQLSPLVIYMFAAIWMNGRQRKRANATLEGNNAQAHAAQRQAMIGFYGTIIAAILSVIGNAVVAAMNQQG